MMQEPSVIANCIPDTIRQLARRIGCRADATATQVELRQAGMMRQDKASQWMPFKARQQISADRCEFEWVARTGPAGIIHIRDAFVDGHGALSVKLLGLVPILRMQSSGELDRGETMRYLAELAWAPDAILLNSQLDWNAMDETHFMVSVGARSRRAEIVLSLNSEGLIAEALANDRPRAFEGTFVPTAWRGVFSDYRRCDGRLIPTSGEVGWVTGGEYEPVWRGRIIEWRVSQRHK